MRFIDANVFLYAVLITRKPLPEPVVRRKAAAKDIFLRVNSGEPVVTTTVHLSEVANVLEDSAGIVFAGDLLDAILSKPSVEVATVSADDYRDSLVLAKKFGVSINDALALVIMEQKSIEEIYTFDRHFEQAPVRIVQQ